MKPENVAAESAAIVVAAAVGFCAAFAVAVVPVVVSVAVTNHTAQTHKHLLQYDDDLQTENRVQIKCKI